MMTDHHGVSVIVNVGHPLAVIVSVQMAGRHNDAAVQTVHQAVVIVHIAVPLAVIVDAVQAVHQAEAAVHQTAMHQAGNAPAGEAPAAHHDRRLSDAHGDSSEHDYGNGELHVGCAGTVCVLVYCWNCDLVLMSSVGRTGVFILTDHRPKIAVWTF